MPYRKTIFYNNGYYHITNRCDFDLFKDSTDYTRFIDLIDYYRYPQVNRFSRSLNKDVSETVTANLDPQVLVISYCLLPNHFHVVIKQVSDSGIKKFIHDVCLGYSKYFNLKYARKGPVFYKRYFSREIYSDSDLLHTCRYIHLNPYSAGISKSFKEIFTYPYSSLQSYLSLEESLIDKDDLLSYFKTKDKFKKFVTDRAEYQKSLQKIKLELRRF